MAVVLDTRKVRGVQEVVLNVLEQHKHDFAPIEVLYGLSELVARLIVRHTKGTWIEKREVFEQLIKHMENTAIEGVKHEGHHRIHTIN